MKKGIIAIGCILISFCLMCSTTQPGKNSPESVGDYYILSDEEFGSLISKFTLEHDGQVTGDLQFIYKAINNPDVKSLPIIRWSTDDNGFIILSFCNTSACSYKVQLSVFYLGEDMNKTYATYKNYYKEVKGLRFSDQAIYYPCAQGTQNYEAIIKIKKEINEKENLAKENQIKLQKSVEQLFKGLKKDDVYSFSLVQDKDGNIVGNDEYYKFIQAYFNNYENPDINNYEELKIDEFEFNSRKKDYHEILQQKYLLIKLESMEKMGVDTFDFKKNSYVFENFEDLFYTFGEYKNYELKAIADSYVNSTGNTELAFLLKYNKPLLLKMPSQVAKSFQDNYLKDKKFNNKISLYILAKIVKTEINQYRNRTNIYKYEIPTFNTVRFKRVIINPVKVLAINKTNYERIFISE